MDAPDKDALAADAGPNLPAAAAADAITAPRAPDAPRRCFICLTDEEPSDPAGSWVDPCPCTLEAHQDCMLSWVTDCERSGRPLLCPVCKSAVEMEGAWDPIVALTDVVHRRFRRASPLMLFTAASMGVQFSMQMYGAVALWAFAGKDATMRFVMGPEMMIDGRRAAPLAFARGRIANALTLMNVAPALLLGYFFPGWMSDKVFLPSASFYGIYHVLHDDKFFAWPPSPQLAMAAFPYIRSVYLNLYNELVLPYELRMNRQLLGLPPVQPRQEPGQNGNQNAAAEAARAQGGILGIMQTLIDALRADEGDDEPRVGDFQIELRGEEPDGQAEGEGDGDLMLEVIVEELDMAEAGHGVRDGAAGADHADMPELADDNGDANAAGDAAPAPVVPLAAQPADGAGDQPAANHEAPAAPVRRMGLGELLSNVSSALVSALILPGVCFAAGEALRLVLPKQWTAAPARNPWMRHGSAGARLGLFQQQWGRSLVGGCLYIVLRDMLRVYTKTRKVAALSNRRVKNVDRPRRQRK
ncbi:Zinc finger, RING/FYVE/PHD-type [Cordyceps fumosorosea ARSEF 2679]|uniref:Zinc finger, RING/FYVE/PHD-type n=1 Tax=Cordyceps fumosorosea (strain ARSEF 2679) TaxID=1081104 RepID=A0A167MRE7_CORFA|nr:Zinc finger, RING/FYVE/PHD-type [Cordyceps fumosorosea ARSEF 2679]OAA54673.1 Zinc finger, RING/FYVE/PHD-type [Cordyceps fumosorosea ARSEF 2679]